MREQTRRCCISHELTECQITYLLFGLTAVTLTQRVTQWGRGQVSVSAVILWQTLPAKVMLCLGRHRQRRGYHGYPHVVYCQVRYLTYIIVYMAGIYVLTAKVKCGWIFIMLGPHWLNTFLKTSLCRAMSGFPYHLYIPISHGCQQFLHFPVSRRSDCRSGCRPWQPSVGVV